MGIENMNDITTVIKETVNEYIKLYSGHICSVKNSCDINRGYCDDFSSEINTETRAVEGKSLKRTEVLWTNF